MFFEPIILFHKNTMDPTAQYILSFIIFIAIPFILYVSYSIYFWKKKFDFRNFHNPGQYKPMSNELKQITIVAKIYIFLNILTGAFSAYSTVLYRDEIRPEIKDLAVLDSREDLIQKNSLFNGIS